MIVEKRRSYKDGIPPFHPGEYLADELAEIQMSPAKFDAALALTPGTTALLLDGCIDITPELALRLSHYFGGGARLWMSLQSTHDVKIYARQHGRAIAAQVRPLVDYGCLPHDNSPRGWPPPDDCQLP